MKKRNYTETATKAPESLVFYKNINDYIMINSAIHINETFQPKTSGRNEKYALLPIINPFTAAENTEKKLCIFSRVSQSSLTEETFQGRF